jgi:hypothetical protein
MRSLNRIRMIAIKYYTSSTEFDCGIDLHAHQIYVCAMDRTDKKLVHANIKQKGFRLFSETGRSCQHDLTVCAECMFGWHWLADAREATGLTFVLAHVL